MLNKNSLKRLQLVDMAMHGVVQITMAQQHGKPSTFRATLLPTTQECATMNSEEYYRGQGTTKSKASRLKAKKKKLIGDHSTWEEKLDRSINVLYVVDADECRWRPVSMKSLLSIDEWEVIIPHRQLKGNT